MKSLEQLTNVERAKLLHTLFPENIEGFLNYAIGLIEYLETNKNELSESWAGQFFTFDAWYDLAMDAKQRIDSYRSQLIKRSGMFADQLFDGYTCFWTADTLIKYAEHGKSVPKRFKAMIEILFLPAS
jgi:hypothetical protein